MIHNYSFIIVVKFLIFLSHSIWEIYDSTFDLTFFTLLFYSIVLHGHCMATHWMLRMSILSLLEYRALPSAQFRTHRELVSCNALGQGYPQNPHWMQLLVMRECALFCMKQLWKQMEPEPVAETWQTNNDDCVWSRQVLCLSRIIHDSDSFIHCSIAQFKW